MTKRRDFIKKSALGSAGITIGAMGFNAKSYGSIIGSNERINVAVCGIGGRGQGHLTGFSDLKESHNVMLTTICDVDEKFWAQGGKTVAGKIGVTPKFEWDMRKVFDNKDIHAVSFATPNHWHALGTIWACQAGKHVYVEKPIHHVIGEGRKMIEAGKKYKVHIQTGFGPTTNEAMDFLHSGGIGEVYMARGLCIKPRDSFGKVPNSEPPASLHYDMWLGPAPSRPYNEKRVHYSWNWFWDTGNGDTGNQGSHQLNAARVALQKMEHPVSVSSDGGKYGTVLECEQETPDTQQTVLKYADGKMIVFDTRGAYSNGEGATDVKIGNIFYGTEGYMEYGNNWRAYRKREKEPFAGAGIGERKEGERRRGVNAFSNFIEVIRSGRDEDLINPVLGGHYSTCLPHLANISFLTGRKLKFDGATEKFADDAEANKLLTKVYRKPFVVPEKV